MAIQFWPKRKSCHTPKQAQTRFDPIARFPRLLNAPEGADTDKLLNDAMKAVERENEDLKELGRVVAELNEAVAA